MICRLRMKHLKLFLWGSEYAIREVTETQTERNRTENRILRIMDVSELA